VFDSELLFSYSYALSLKDQLLYITLGYPIINLFEITLVLV